MRAVQNVAPLARRPGRSVAPPDALLDFGAALTAGAYARSARRAGPQCRANWAADWGRAGAWAPVRVCLRKFRAVDQFPVCVSCGALACERQSRHSRDELAGSEQRHVKCNNFARSLFIRLTGAISLSLASLAGAGCVWLARAGPSQPVGCEPARLGAGQRRRRPECALLATGDQIMYHLWARKSCRAQDLCHAP